MDVLALNELGDNPLQTGLVVDHVGHQSALKLALTLGDVDVETLVASADFDDGTTGSDVTGHTVGTNEVQFVSDVDDWNGHVLLEVNLVEIFFECVVGSGSKLKGWSGEESVALLLKLGLGVV